MKRKWIYKGIGQTHGFLRGKKYVHVWECNGKIKTKDV